ncbi:MAG: GNAT family N-acetyltransferase [Firmicutes bacterium]|nr:GNAT family N-acetyltransferase [Bacillota bacterium]
MELRTRKANREDLMLLYGWANDPLTRKMSLNKGTVSLETYYKWFNIYLHDDNILFLIVEGLDKEDWIPIAQVRLHADGEISFSVAKDYRGKGLAARIIINAIEFAKSCFPVNCIVAKVKKDNLASIKSLERAGFNLIGEDTIKRESCYVYEKYL